MAQFLCIGFYGPFTNLPFNCCAIYFDSKVFGGFFFILKAPQRKFSSYFLMDSQKGFGTIGCPAGLVIVTIVSNFASLTYLGDFTTSLHGGYNPFTKYDGYSSMAHEFMAGQPTPP